MVYSTQICIVNYLHRKPLYFRSMSLLSSWSLIASRMASDETNPVFRTSFNKSSIDIRGRRTTSKMGVGSIPWFAFAHSQTARKMSISAAQNESLASKSRTEFWNKEEMKSWKKDDEKQAAANCHVCYVHLFIAFFKRLVAPDIESVRLHEWWRKQVPKPSRSEIRYGADLILSRNLPTIFSHAK